MLEAKNIKKSFDGLEILSGVNLNISPGTVTILTGSSGSGKSTLLRCLSLLDMPCSGQIVVDELEYSFPGTNLVRESNIYPKITCVFQQLYLWPHLSNRKNILLSLINCDHDIECLDRYIDLFGMSKFIDKFPNESSLGQKQRVSLVRSLVLKSKYLLLDEVTSALDSYNTDIVLSELYRLSEENKGILLISHDHRIINNKDYSPILLENGRII